MKTKKSTLYKKMSFWNLLGMKVLLILTLLFCEIAIAQQNKMPVSISINVNVDTIQTRKYYPNATPVDKSIKTAVLKMQYGSAEILNPSAIEDLIEGICNVISVDIVYTDYREHDFQDNLNRKRLAELYFLCPSIFTQSMTKWSYVKQYGYDNEEDKKKLFHGIVVKYIKVPLYSPGTVEKMICHIKENTFKDTSMFDIFNRLIKFKDELVCVDFTGSMSPYYLQLMVWLNLKKDKKTLSCSFFNDGNRTPDYLKRPGKTGGIYTVRSNSIDTIVRYAHHCIYKGTGGDSPENNIEAIIEGLKKFPNTKKITMIADNWADMRDYSMISRVKIPVKVIVCGKVFNGINNPLNPQYLDLARKTGGSVHTMEEDILNLMSKKEGDEITVDGVTYVISNDRFIRK
jgi:hypothetical protein